MLRPKIEFRENFHPHGNMIKNTTDALSAVLGGCNALTLCAEDEDSEMTNRIALNVSNILKEESHLDKVSTTPWQEPMP